MSNLKREKKKTQTLIFFLFSFSAKCLWGRETHFFSFLFAKTFFLQPCFASAGTFALGLVRPKIFICFLVLIIARDGHLNFCYWILDIWTLDFWSYGHLNFCTFELLDNWTFGQLNFWIIELRIICQKVQLSEVQLSGLKK